MTIGLASQDSGRPQSSSCVILASRPASRLGGSLAPRPAMPRSTSATSTARANRRGRSAAANDAALDNPVAVRHADRRRAPGPSSTYGDERAPRGRARSGLRATKQVGAADGRANRRQSHSDAHRTTSTSAARRDPALRLRIRAMGSRCSATPPRRRASRAAGLQPIRRVVPAGVLNNMLSIILGPPKPAQNADAVKHEVELLPG